MTNVANIIIDFKLITFTKENKDMTSKQFFKEISDGMIDGNIFFDVFTYVYTVHDSTPRDRYYVPPTIEESNTKGECIIEYYEDDEGIVANIEDMMNFDWNNFPSRFMSLIEPQICRIEGEAGEDIRTIVIPFEDMSDSSNESYRMEIMLEKKKLISIIFTETKIDEQFHGTMKSLQLIGEMK